MAYGEPVSFCMVFNPSEQYGSKVAMGTNLVTGQDIKSACQHFIKLDSYNIICVILDLKVLHLIPENRSYTFLYCWALPCIMRLFIKLLF
jgi:hypothetical protein